MTGCKPKTPSQYIQPDEIEDILVDYHVTRAMAQAEGSYSEQCFNRALYWENVLRKHGVTQAEFDSSLTYYYSRADRFNAICKRVMNRIDERATLLGVTEGDIGKYAALKTDGDTANIWPGQTSLVMMPIPPLHRHEFTIHCDSTFWEGDKLLFQFMSDFVYQTGTKDGLFYVAVTYPDTVVVQRNTFSYSGLCQLTVASAADACPQEIKGFFCLGGFNDPSTTLRLLFIDNIQLIRFHTKDERTTTSQKGGVKPGAAAQRSDVAPDSGGTPVRAGPEVLSVGQRTSSNRVVERIDSIKGRTLR